MNTTPDATPGHNGASPSRKGLTGRTVFLMLCGFFGSIFAVNTYFMTEAIKTYTGEVAQEPYRKGLTYNRRIAADAKQAELGWDVAVDVVQQGHTRLTFTSPDKKPVTALKVTATLGRPTTNADDRALTLLETSPGQYEADTPTLAAGGWILNATASGQDASEPLYRLRKRVWLKP